MPSLQHLPQGGHHPLIRTPQDGPGPGDPAVHQPPQPVLAVAGPHPPYRHHAGGDASR